MFMSIKIIIRNYYKWFLNIYKNDIKINKIYNYIKYLFKLKKIKFKHDIKALKTKFKIYIGSFSFLS